ncbi:hypothetical protein CONPUDRAFT_168316 [Coniophora puteana RWD-64-598 SS2]|uniref:Class I glutamine amidotransferase-like protein n=1 Tax=Coniophora puteana (strain RWD-64-598) TaxID=741705 RepID=A0A5M3ME12_CONPW|nr:uncharacterized protein CONPUDRAFT_168316 [Coniophora puteana RWD-64-598 SS2]EIW77373.1 hypothetical protein CONPUDRAFT_168316 [Coniophora puteana RWD-64-598 SS2]
MAANQRLPPPPPSSLRIALLSCGEPSTSSAFIAQHGDLCQRLETFLQRTAPVGLGAVPFVSQVYDVTQMVYPTSPGISGTDNVQVEGGIEVFDAIVVAGSTSRPYDDEEWILEVVEYLQRVMAECPDLKLIGIGIGHYIVGATFGTLPDPGSSLITSCENGSSSEKRTDWEPRKRIHQLISSAVFSVRLAARLRLLGERKRSQAPVLGVWGRSESAVNRGMISLRAADILSSSTSSSLPGGASTLTLSSSGDDLNKVNAAERGDSSPEASASPLNSGNANDIAISNAYAGIFTCQGHPELATETARALVDALEGNDVISAKAAEDHRLRESLNEDGERWEDGDGDEVGQVIWRVLLGKDVVVKGEGRERGTRSWGDTYCRRARAIVAFVTMMTGVVWYVQINRTGF